ncbi:hypothetical protein HOLleu_01656 [Holothuria leucospilota]|uniref:Uncharacterized protein n=1 Tax=Holothuria leucospilota TaxID=206669 RepID=A0A9Q1HKZ3_HOLLE|nr:hypothetical protein HOLleu_01656 [Holothuria leucospilota]
MLSEINPPSTTLSSPSTSEYENDDPDYVMGTRSHSSDSSDGEEENQDELKVLNLNRNELEQLANHLGHDVNVHQQYYRLPQEVLFLAKVSKVLLAAEKGNLSAYKGKSLEEMDVMDKCSEDEMSEGEDDYFKIPEARNPSSSHDNRSGSAQRKKTTRTTWTKEKDTLLQDPHIAI